MEDLSLDQVRAKVMETQPYFPSLGSSSVTAGAPAQIGRKVMIYDVLGRVAEIDVADPHGQHTMPDGSGFQAARTTYAYSGLTVTVTNDKGQTRTEEKTGVSDSSWLRNFRIDLRHCIGARLVRIRSGNRIQRVRIGITGPRFRFWILHDDSLLNLRHLFHLTTGVHRRRRRA